MNENYIIIARLIGIPVLIVGLDIGSLVLSLYRPTLINKLIPAISVCLQIIAFLLVFRDGIVADNTGGEGDIFGNSFANMLVILSIAIIILNFVKNGFAKGKKSIS